MNRFGWLVSAFVAGTLSGCGGGGGGNGNAPPIPQAPPTPTVNLATEHVFSALTFNSPVAALQAPNENGTRWFVVEQGGVVRVFPNDPAVTPTGMSIFAAIGDRVAATAEEAGLLGMAFHPQWGLNNERRVYLSYTAPRGGSGLVSRISEFRSVDGGLTLDTTSPGSERVLLSINQPEANHNGGGITFGSDGFLYIGMGDGGGANDQHGSIGNGQLLTTMLGKMLRIDVDLTPGASVPYEIPPGNPFSTNARCGPDGGGFQCPEIFAWGFRNPWRWSFDRTTGELWVGDVGQASREEAGRVSVGQNHGWRCREGSQDSNPGACGNPTTLINPQVEYGRAAGSTITGGYVYRGSAIPGLQGRYVFGDFGSGRVWHIANDTMPTLDVTNTTNAAPVLSTGFPISSFAEDVNGELYIVHYGGQLHRLRAN